MPEPENPPGGGVEGMPQPGADCSTGAGASEGAVQVGGKKLTAKQIGDDWGTSRAYASMKIKQGCPTHSLEAAREWRVKNSKYGVGYRSKAGAKTVAASEVPSPETREGDPASQKIPRPRARPQVESEEDEKLPETPDVLSLKRSLEAAVEIEWCAFTAAFAGKIEAQIRAYNNARDGRFAAEKAYREELERRRVLVPLSEAMVLSRKGYDVIKPALLAMGARIGGNCNPANPASASMEIDREVAAILKQGENAYAVGPGPDIPAPMAPAASAANGMPEEFLT